MNSTMRLGSTLRLAGIALAGTIAVSACGSAYAADKRDLTIAVTTLPVHLDPANLNRNVNSRFTENVFETLLVYDHATSALKPGLATAWKMISPTTMELEIRKGVLCHDGSEFTAEDVAVMYGPKRLLVEGAPGFRVGKQQYLPTLSAVEAVGTHTVRLTTDKPDPLLALRLTVDGTALPCAKAFLASRNWEQWGQAPVGTGPYKVAEIRPGEINRFEAFDRYWGEKAPLASFAFKVIPEVGARVAGLLAGQFDMITEVAPDQFKTIVRGGVARVEGGPTQTIRLLFFDRHNPAMADPRVRQALSLAIDRKLITETIFENRTPVPQGMQMPNFGRMFVGEHRPAEYDPARARELLKQAGYKGTEIAYRYMNDYYAGEVTIAQTLQQMWKAVGINVRLELKENWDQVLAPENRGINNYSSTALFPDPAPQLQRTFGPGGPFQSNKFGSDPRFDEANGRLLSADPDQRRAAFADMLRVFEEDAPGTYLHVLPVFYGVRKGIDWKTSGNGIFMDFRAGAIAFSTM